MEFLNSVALRRFCDFLNVNFVFCAMMFFNVSHLIIEKRTFFIITLYTAFYLVLIIFNAYACYVILRIKDRVSSNLITACSEQQVMSQEQKKLLRGKLERSLQLGDLAEVAFGRLGRLVTESALMLTILSMAIAQMTTVRLVFVITSKIANNDTVIKETEWNSTHEIESGDMHWSGELGTYAAIFLPIFILFSLLPSYRSLGPISFIANVALIIPFIHMISLYYELGATYINFDNMKRLDPIEVYESASPQLGYVILALSNSAADDRRGFRISFVIASIIASITTFTVTFGLFFYKSESDIWKYPLLMKFHSELPPNIFMLMGYVAFIFVLNLPLFQLLDRWASKMIETEDPLETAETEDPLDGFQALVPDSSSVFEKLRKRGRLREPPNIQSQDVFRDMKAELPLWLFVFLRVVVVLAEWGFSILCWNNNVAIMVFIAIEMVSTIYIGYVLPVIQHLLFMWYEIHIVNKLMSISFVIVMIGVTIYSYVINEQLYRSWSQDS